MSCDKRKLETNWEIIGGAHPENNYRLSLNHAPSVGASWQYLNYNVAEIGKEFASPRGTDLFKWIHGVCSALIRNVWALTLSLPCRQTPSSAQRTAIFRAQLKVLWESNVWACASPAATWPLRYTPRTNTTSELRWTIDREDGRHARSLNAILPSRCSEASEKFVITFSGSCSFVVLSLRPSNFSTICKIHVTSQERGSGSRRVSTEQEMIRETSGLKAGSPVTWPGCRPIRSLEHQSPSTGSWQGQKSGGKSKVRNNTINTQCLETGVFCDVHIHIEEYCIHLRKKQLLCFSEFTTYI